VDWTPVFARGKVWIYVVDPEAAKHDPLLPQKLCDSANLAKFIRNVLPGILNKMKVKYHWADLPRVVVHDKASYMVTSQHERLQVAFAGALNEAGLKSWAGHGAEPTNWLVKKFGDVYLHETLISHIRRLLGRDFAVSGLGETPVQFQRRMKLVEDHLNSDSFAAIGGRGLAGLARSLRDRCEEVIKRKGQRLDK
jgi:hypothetical protein